MFAQFEDTEDSQYTDEDEGCTLFGTLTVSNSWDGDQCDEVRQNGHHIKDIHDVLAELPFVGTTYESEHELNGKPDDTDGFYDEESIGVVGRHFVRHPSIEAHVHTRRPLEAG